MIKKIIKRILSNPSLRALFNLTWNINYDITFHDIAKDYNEAVSKINNHPKFKNLDETHSLINEGIENIKDIKVNRDLQHALIPIMISALNQSNIKIESILDVGGGHQPVSLYIKKYCNIEIQSSVIETAVSTKKFNAIISKKINFIKYFSDLKFLDSQSFDLVYFGSVIQYFEGKEYDIIKETISYNPKLIAFTNNFFIDQDDDLYSLQGFGTKHLIPHKFFSYKKMINFFKDQKYKLIFDIDQENLYIHKKLDNKNFKNKSLVFIRQD
jgi:putative methyltransferase (TIGR04325 family)